MKLLLSALSKAFFGFLFICLLFEEKVLEEGLKGYSEYKTKVRFRLIPFIW